MDYIAVQAIENALIRSTRRNAQNAQGVFWALSFHPVGQAHLYRCDDCHTRRGFIPFTVTHPLALPARGCVTGGIIQSTGCNFKVTNVVLSLVKVLPIMKTIELRG